MSLFCCRVPSKIPRDIYPAKIPCDIDPSEILRDIDCSGFLSFPLSVTISQKFLVLDKLGSADQAFCRMFCNVECSAFSSHDLSLLMPTLITWLSLWLSRFSSVRLLCFPVSTLCSSEGNHLCGQAREVWVLCHLLEWRIATQGFFWHFSMWDICLFSSIYLFIHSCHH